MSPMWRISSSPRVPNRGKASRTPSDTRCLGELLALARDVAGHTGDVVEVDDEWLASQEIGYWMGPRSLPLWLPSNMPGFSTRSNAAYLAAGGHLRDIRDILERTLDDERMRGLGRPRGAGLTRADELALLARL